jgi:hypothetical protein
MVMELCVDRQMVHDSVPEIKFVETQTVRPEEIPAGVPRWLKMVGLVVAVGVLLILGIGA